MAQRRMFSLKIVDTDKFSEMSVSSRELYFQLGLRADDDGFVSNPKNIVKITGASEDDIKMLIVKKYIIPFDSGVVVISDWKENNYLRSDRYKETKHIEEKSMLLEINNKYTLGIPKVNQRYTQARLGQVRSGQERESSVAASDSKNDSFNFNDELLKLTGNKRRDLQIIGLYWQYKNFSFENYQQYQGGLQRELKSVKNLVGYSDDEIINVMDWLSENADFKWTIETIHKYINEDLSNIKTNKK